MKKWTYKREMKFLSQFVYRYAPTQYRVTKDGDVYYISTILFVSIGHEVSDGYHFIESVGDTRYRAQRQAFRDVREELWDRCLYFGNNKLGAMINERSR